MMKRTGTLAISCILAALVFGGCATSGGAGAPAPKSPSTKAVSDKDQIMASINAWKAGLVAKNVGQIMAVYSDSYKDTQGRGKADLQKYITDAISQGYLDNVKVDIDKAIVTVNGETATAGPVTLEGSMGTVSLMSTWAKEGAGWKIVAISRG